jgi:hypothetical protein
MRIRNTAISPNIFSHGALTVFSAEAVSKKKNPNLCFGSFNRFVLKDFFSTENSLIEDQCH